MSTSDREWDDLCPQIVFFQFLCFATKQIWHSTSFLLVLVFIHLGEVSCFFQWRSSTGCWSKKKKKNKETFSVKLVFSNPSSQHCIKWYCIWKALAPIISSYLAHSSGLHYTLLCELSCCQWCHLVDFNSVDIFLSLIKADII